MKMQIKPCAGFTTCHPEEVAGRDIVATITAFDDPSKDDDVAPDAAAVFTICVVRDPN